MINIYSFFPENDPDLPLAILIYWLLIKNLYIHLTRRYTSPSVSSLTRKSSFSVDNLEKAKQFYSETLSVYSNFHMVPYLWEVSKYLSHS